MTLYSNNVTIKTENVNRYIRYHTRIKLSKSEQLIIAFVLV